MNVPGWIRSAARKVAGVSPPVIAARMDVAQSSNANDKHWADANSLSADLDLSPGDRRLARQRSRLEVQNNSYARGITLTLVNDTISTGPKLEIEHEFGDEIEAAWQRFAKHVKLTQTMQTAALAKTVDGESFTILQRNVPAFEGVRLGLRLIECDRVCSEWGIAWRADKNDVDGVRLDALGNPVSYRVLKAHPGGLWPTTEAFDVPAANMLHMFRQDRPEQHRGVPEIAAALPLFAQLRRFTLATLDAAETAANVAAAMSGGIPNEGADFAVGDALEFRRGMLLNIPAGMNVTQIRPEHPATTYAEFKHEIINEIARCLNMPFNIAAGNSSGYNYASGRLDHQVYFRAIDTDRDTRWTPAYVDRIFLAWWSQYRLTQPQYLSIDEPPRHYYWPKPEHVDPTKAATAAKTRLESGVTNPQIECAMLGYDWREVADGWREYLQYAPSLSKEGANGNPEVPAGE
jgi:capsid protein